MPGADNDFSPTPPPAAVTPLDYAGPMPPPPRRARGWKSRVLEGLIVLGIILLLISILTPNTSSSRTMAERVACSANLRSIGQSLQMYANANRGRFPDTLEQVVLGGYVPDVRIFLCASSTDTPARGATAQALAADLSAGGHLSYTYVGRGVTSAANANTVLAYEHARHHKGGGGIVLYADGHAEWLVEKDIRAVADWYAAGNGPMVFRGAASPPPATRAATTPSQTRAAP